MLAKSDHAMQSDQVLVPVQLVAACEATFQSYDDRPTTVRDAPEPELRWRASKYEKLN